MTPEERCHYTYVRPDHMAVGIAPRNLFYDKRVMRAPRCEYCRGIFNDDRVVCRNCGAPR
jgi:hypothetical protein